MVAYDRSISFPPTETVCATRNADFGLSGEDASVEAQQSVAQNRISLIFNNMAECHTSDILV
jgi:hypothetical protein